MSVGASITRRVTASDEPRYAVRYRMGGRAFPVQNAGTFATLREARLRRDLVAGEIANGRDPRVLLAALADSARVRNLAPKTLAVWASEYEASRVDVADETRRGIKVRTAAMLPVIGGLTPAEITPQTVTGLIAGLKLKPSSLRRYIATLRDILDYAGVDPNPVRDARVRLPQEVHEELEPPSGADVAQIVAHSPARWRLALQTLAETGMRVGELHQLEWRDVDQAGARFRVRVGKTAAARRWVAVPADLMAEVASSTPPDDRTAERRVFPGATPPTLKNVVRRACKAAGIAHYSPHDLRHRYASVQVARGVPLPMLSAQLGHSRKSMTLDTYSHVLLNEENGG